METPDIIPSPAVFNTADVLVDTRSKWTIAPAILEGRLSAEEVRGADLDQFTKSCGNCATCTCGDT